MKKIVKIVMVLVVLLLLVVISVPLWIDYAAKRAIEDGGTYAMGVETRLDKISISLFGGEVTMSGLDVANPDGFSTPHFVKLGKGHVAVSLGSLTKEKIVVPTLRIEGVDVNLDRNDVAANYEVILENLKKFESKDEVPDEKGKAYVIEEIVVTNIKVDAKLSIGGILKPTVPVRIDEMRFERVGEKPISLSQVIGIVLKGILRGVLEEAGGRLPKEIVGGLANGLGKLKDVTRVIGDAGGVVGDVGKGVGKAVDGIGKGIGGLLGGKKKDKAEEEDDK